MNTMTKLARKLGLQKPKHYTLHAKREDYFALKTLAAQEKMSLLDFLHELLAVYITYKKQKHDVTIRDLLEKQHALVDKLQLYQKRFGKIYLSPAANTSKSSSNGDLR